MKTTSLIAVTLSILVNAAALYAFDRRASDAHTPSGEVVVRQLPDDAEVFAFAAHDRDAHEVSL